MQKAETKETEIEEQTPLDTKKLLEDAVDRTITIKLPRKFDEYLQGIAKTLERSVESVILEDVYQLLSSFFQGGHADAWQEYIIEHNTVDWNSLEKEIDKIADIVLDC